MFIKNSFEQCQQNVFFEELILPEAKILAKVAVIDSDEKAVMKRGRNDAFYPENSHVRTAQS